jgi:prolipoprotein diacylglyceryltransferase
VQPLGRFPAFYGTRRFITEFTRAHHLSQTNLVHNIQLVSAIAYSSIILIIEHFLVLSVVGEPHLNLRAVITVFTLILTGTSLD